MADQVRLEHPPEILAIGVEQEPQRRRPQRARVVDEDVDWTDEQSGSSCSG
jgi:hypothetical protein